MDEHVGKKLLRVDLNASCSPCITAIMAPDADLEVIAELLSADLDDMLRDRLGEYEWCLQSSPKFTVRPGSGIIKPEAEQRAEWRSHLEKIHEATAAADIERTRRRADNPDNGKRGWWRVDGIRNSCLVGNVSTEQEAIDKAAVAGQVHEWETPDASFVGVDLGEVISL